MTRRRALAATLFTLVALAILVGLGQWQLDRRVWKADLIARYEAASRLPPVEPRDFFKSMVGEKDLAYRRGVADCRPGLVRPYDLRGGVSATGQGGYWILVNCGDQRRSPDLVVAIGWAGRPDVPPIRVDTTVAGTLLLHPYGDAPDRPRFLLVAERPVPPLLAARQPDPRDLPDNHLGYALTWFGLAAALLGVYLVYIRPRAPAPHRPNSVDLAPTTPPDVPPTSRRQPLDHRLRLADRPPDDLPGR